MALRDAIQRVALEFPSYGWRRITAELRREKWAVNHKRVYRWMRADNLLCLRKRKFVVTTDSDHGLPVYPNLARALTPTGLDQLWGAELTYVRLELEFVYLAVLLDAFSRRVIGWALEHTLEATLTLQALRMALARRRLSPGLVHHSDRGVQYASRDYTQLLHDHGIQISMSRKGNPWDSRRERRDLAGWSRPIRTSMLVITSESRNREGVPKQIPRFYSQMHGSVRTEDANHGKIPSR